MIKIMIKKERIRPKGATFLTTEDCSEYSVVYFDTTDRLGRMRHVR